MEPEQIAKVVGDIIGVYHDKLVRPELAEINMHLEKIYRLLAEVGDMQAQHEREGHKQPEEV